MKSTYKPPFTISSKAINQIADISAQIERYAIRMEQEDGLLLRKINRIKTIQSSLAIEGNTLSETMITEILEGKPVVAPVREIQEVKNAIKIYDAFAALNPYRINDLLRAHGLMMEALVNDAGRFRRGGVGVFAGAQAVHIAPPPERVPFLMDDLFTWIKESDDHLLIKSCVFHCEFEFIHPFSDGNGRMGRLWQSLILCQLHPIFEHLPVENIVFQNQHQYYEAISRSTKETDCIAFIEFMLEEILATLKKRQGEPLGNKNYVVVNVGVNVGVKNISEKILLMVEQKPGINANEIAASIPDKTKRTIERQIAKLKDARAIEFKGAAKTGGYFIKTNG